MGPSMDNRFDRHGYARWFDQHGYFVQNGVLDEAEVNELRQALTALPESEAVRRRQNVYGVRNLLGLCPRVVELAQSPSVRQFVTPLLGEAAFAVRAIFFDKVPGANWSLHWHQDNVIAVAERLDVPGFTGWSQKAGVWQVQPPADVLARMIAVRVHLDDCDADNGPLRVLPGSHKEGWLDEQLERWKTQVPEVVCVVASGGVVTMCPLTLHASAAARSARHRRVIHLEFAADELPGGLEWRHRIPAEADHSSEGTGQVKACFPLFGRVQYH